MNMNILEIFNYLPRIVFFYGISLEMQSRCVQQILSLSLN
jgi:hypothetical protein